MFDIKLIRDNKDAVQAGLQAKKTQVDLDKILADDEAYRKKLVELDDLRAEKNAASAEIGLMAKNQENAHDKITEMRKVAEKIDALEPEVKDLQKAIADQLIGLPNLAHTSVPVGGEDKNQTVRTWGDPITFDFKPKTHIEIAEGLDIVDFKRATKLSGSGFLLFKGQGAQLQRALFSFMLDTHTQEHGYHEVLPPVLVNRASMTATGQLPKMEEDMYKLTDDDLFLIPTAEVPVTNIHRDEVLAEKDLPIKYCAYSGCFRREAGSYGKDTKGMIRVHQFDKVELVKFVPPENSYEELEKLVADAEKIFQLLNLPYRVLLLASGDISFAAAKCYDIEVFSSGVEAWLEVSSCSNFEDFQARRASIRYKGETTKKPTFVHTLNGSGVALARAFVAILENNQTPEGDVIIPDVLRPYMGGAERITK